MDQAINLPDVTLITIDTAYYDLTRMAIEDSCQNIKFAKIIAFTDKPDAFDVDETVRIEAKNNIEAAQILWYEASKHVTTSHVLTIQWDGWVVNSHMWNNAWLNYDYIGAPWTYRDDLSVGNGGFSLRSKKLMVFLATNSDFPFEDSEDDTICRKYRRKLESYGFKWPDQAVAERFSFEHPPTNSFGFHGVSNWPLVLSENKLRIRKSYITKRIKDNHRQVANFNAYAKLAIESGFGYGFLKEPFNG